MIRVFDSVVSNPEEYREAALKQEFQSVTIGNDTFHGIAGVPDPEFAAWFAATFPKYEPTLTFLRKSPSGQMEPNLVHSDETMGDLTAILFLNPEPPEADGTKFWGRSGQGIFEIEKVPARFNRAVVFTASLLHSRSIAENYGEGNDARLIQVLFASKAKQEKPRDN